MPHLRHCRIVIVSAGFREVGGEGAEIENRIIEAKSRGIYETPGATALWLAHRDLEGLAMDKEVMHLRDSLIPKYAELVYYGFWFSPEMKVLQAAIDETIEQLWIRQWLFYANSVRYAQAMNGPDYAAFKNGWWSLTENLQSMQKHIEIAGKLK